MNLIRHEDELWLYPGADQVFLYRESLALGQFRFDYAYSLGCRGATAVRRTV